ncbi:hypothetical protein [Pararhizobium arenae]|uniref:hypothetical protein n=1 Tax=Pararhizobium arenae TaxID=1856850 RepID=UPI00094B145C|nr:hypothetical protein [Pararhizobium arenae]
MPFIRSPAVHGDYEDRFMDCQHEADGPVSCLVADMVAAGWDGQEALAAIIEVADSMMLAYADRKAVEEILKRLR